MSDATSSSERLGLSRALSEFLIELSIALHRHSMYPSGHPSLEPAAEAVLRRAERLFADREFLTFGVARRQLVIEGVSTDPRHPVLRRLAEGLHRHQLGAVTLCRGLETPELSDAMRALAAEPDRAGALGLGDEAALERWPHVRLHPLAFGRLALVEEPSEPPTRDGQLRGELWIGLARAAMSAREGGGADTGGGDGGGERDPTRQQEPAVVAHAIDTHGRHEAYDQVVAAYLKQIATELRTFRGAETLELRRRTSELIRRLDPRTLQSLVALSGEAGRFNEFVFEATHGVALDAVIEIAKAAAEANGQTISHGLVRMLAKLATHAERGPDAGRERADAELREQVLELLADWQLEDPNPERYGQRLQLLATSQTLAWAHDATDVEQPDDPLRIVQMSLELGTPGPLLDRAIDRLVIDGGLDRVVDLATRPPAGGDEAASRILGRCLSDRALRTLLSRDPLDVVSLDRVLPLIPAEHYGLLLDALTTAGNRVTRRRLLDRLAEAPVDIAALVQERLADERWYVQRNVLVLLQRSRRLPAGFSPHAWATHPDGRVRLEAVRLWLGMPGEREAALECALLDEDTRVVRAGLLDLQQDCPPEWVPLLAGLLADGTTDGETRLLAVHALEASRREEALQILLQVVDGGRTLLGRPRIAPKSAQVLAALTALHRSWPTDARVEPVLQAAAASPDDDVRAAAGGLR